MEAFEFWKMNGSGNDFIIIDNTSEDIPEEEMGRIVKSLCRRRESVGADGVIFVLDSEEYDFAWRYFNADGGEVEMCGNGGRCVSRFAYLKGISGPEITFGTKAGPISSEVKGRIVKVLMPKPEKFEKDIDLGLEGSPGWRSIDFINTGVPHVVVNVEDLAGYPVVEHGRTIRYHQRFSPAGTNADFITITGKNRIDLRTYERGVEDETLACGTGAIAGALVSSLRGEVSSPVKVKTQGGEELTVYFQSKQEQSQDFEKVWLEGTTSIIFQAQVHKEAF